MLSLLQADESAGPIDGAHPEYGFAVPRVPVQDALQRRRFPVKPCCSEPVSRLALHLSAQSRDIGCGQARASLLDFIESS